MIATTIAPAVNIESRASATVNSNVVESLRHMSSSNTTFWTPTLTPFAQHQVFQLTYGTAIPIINGLPKRSLNMAPIPSGRELIARRGLAPRKICATLTVAPKPQSRTWVPISAPQTGLVHFEPCRKLYETIQCAALHGIGHIDLI